MNHPEVNKLNKIVTHSIINDINQKIDDIKEVNGNGISIKKLQHGVKYAGLHSYHDKVRRKHRNMITRIKSQIDTLNILAKEYNSMRLGSDANYNNGHKVSLEEFKLTPFFRKEYLDRRIAKITKAITVRQHLDYVEL